MVTERRQFPHAKATVEARTTELMARGLPRHEAFRSVLMADQQLHFEYQLEDNANRPLAIADIKARFGVA